MKAKHFGGVVAILVLMSCEAEDPVSEAEDPVSETVQQPLVVRDNFVDTVVLNNLRQTSDIIDVGQSGFVVGYISPPNNLRFAFYTTSGGLNVPMYQTGTPSVTWLRANTTRSFNVAGCDWNDFVYEKSSQVYWIPFKKCGSGAWQNNAPVRVDSNGGARPSVAWKGDRNFGKLMFVYGRGNQLVARVYQWELYMGTTYVAVGQERVVQDNPGLIVNTDIIYNKHSDRFIVGFTQSSFQTGCTVSNVVLDVYGSVVRAPANVSKCDADQGGHRTSSAYNPGGDGSYVWWSQMGAAPVHGTASIPGSKVVGLYDSSGRFLRSFATDTDSLHSSGVAGTVPVAATHDPGVPYVFFKYNTFGAALYPFGSGFSAVDLPPLDDLGGSIQGGQEAVRAIPTETAALYAKTNGHMYLVVSNMPYAR